MPGNPLVRFDEGRVGRTYVSPSLLLYREISEGLVRVECLSVGDLSQRRKERQEDPKSYSLVEAAGRARFIGG